MTCIHHYSFIQRSFKSSLVHSWDRVFQKSQEKIPSWQALNSNFNYFILTRLLHSTSWPLSHHFATSFYATQIPHWSHQIPLEVKQHQMVGLPL